MSGRVFSGQRVELASDLQARAAQIATGFLQSGIKAGDAVAMLLRNDFPMFEVTYATARIGASTVPINWHFGPDEVGYILRDSASKALIVHADLLYGIANSIPAGILVLAVETPDEIAKSYGIDPSLCRIPDRATDWLTWMSQFGPLDRSAIAANVATIVYTSGTTGKPKGVRRIVDSSETAQRAAASIAALYDARAHARAAITGPMYHSALSAYALGMASAGADVWLLPRFDARQLLEAVQKHRLTHLHLVPIMFTRLLKLPDEVRLRFDVSSLEHVVHAAAPCPIEVKRRMIEWWGPIINEYFGSTETRAIAACNSAEWLEHPGTVGRILPNTDISIIDDEGRALPPGKIGEIYARNHDVEDFAYTGDSNKRAEVERDGLITAGDVGFLDEDGFLFLSDRKRDMINSGGVNIYPIEIEACLLDMQEIRDCAVFGIPDQEYGESVAAAIELHPDAFLDAAAVQAFVRGRLAKYKAPKVVEFHEQLPRDDSGKIFKQRLRSPHWQAVSRSV